MYNIEELILCAFPYHDTHVFVQIVQLIDAGLVKLVIVYVICYAVASGYDLFSYLLLAQK